MMLMANEYKLTGFVRQSEIKVLDRHSKRATIPNVDRFNYQICLYYELFNDSLFNNYLDEELSLMHESDDDWSLDASNGTNRNYWQFDVLLIQPAKAIKFHNDFAEYLMMYKLGKETL